MLMSASIMALCGLMLCYPAEASRNIDRENVCESRQNKHPRNHYQMQMAETSSHTNHPYQRIFKPQAISKDDLNNNGLIYQQIFAPTMTADSDVIQYQLDTAVPYVSAQITPQTTTSIVQPIPHRRSQKKSSRYFQLTPRRQSLQLAPNQQPFQMAPRRQSFHHTQDPLPDSYQDERCIIDLTKQRSRIEESPSCPPSIAPQHKIAPEDIVEATIAPKNTTASLPSNSQGSRPPEVLLPDYQPNESHPLLSRVLQLSLKDPLLIELLKKHPQCSMNNILNTYESLTGQTPPNSAKLLTLEKDYYREKRFLPTSTPQAHQRSAPQNNIIQGTIALLPLDASTDTIIATIKSALRDVYNPDHDSHISLSYLSLSQKIQELQSKGLSATIEEKILLKKFLREKTQIELFGSNKNYVLAMQHLTQALNNRNYTPTQRYAIFKLLSDDIHFGDLTSLTLMLHLEKYKLDLSERVIATLPKITDTMMRTVHNTINVRGLMQRTRELHDPEIHDSSLPELQTLRPFFTTLTIDDLIGPSFPPQSAAYRIYNMVTRNAAPPLQKAAVYEFAATLMLTYLEKTSRQLTLEYNPEIVRRKLEMAIFYLDMESSNRLPIDDSSLKQKVMQKLVQRINNSALRLKHVYIDPRTH